MTNNYNSVPPELAESPEEAIDTIRMNLPRDDLNPAQTVHEQDGKAVERNRISTMISLSRQCFGRPDHTADSVPEYELLESVGQGGMGVVYKARQTSMDRVVALKMLAAEESDNTEKRNRFLTEAVVTGSLEHPNIVPIYDLAMNQEGRLFYAMRRIEGKVWSAAICCRTLNDDLDVLLKVCDAVSFAHSRGVIHRDLKPSNIMLGEFGEVLVLDWGLAADVSGAGLAEKLGGVPRLCGTPLYMAPEMARGCVGLVGIHSDVYLLGAILYEIITGRPPHPRHEYFWDCVLDAAKNVIHPVERSGELLNIALCAMSTAPSDRYPTVKAFQQAILAYRAHAVSIDAESCAEEVLLRAVREDRYDLFSEAIQFYKKALKFWSGNQAAATGLTSALEQYAGCAIQRGEPELAASLLSAENPDHAPLIEKAVRARASYRRHNAQVRLMYGMLSAAGLLIAVLIALFMRGIVQHISKWELVFACDFTQPFDASAQLRFCMKDLNGEIEPPPMDEQGLSLTDGRMFWLRDVHEAGNVKMELDVEWNGQVNGLEVLLNTRVEKTEKFAHVPPGYICQFGAWQGTYHIMSRETQAGSLDQTEAVTCQLKPGRHYRLVFQREGPVCSLRIDGREVMRRTWIMPLPGEDHDAVGVRSWAGDLLIRGLRIHRMRRPSRTSPIIAGDAHYRGGRFAMALREYLNMACDYPDSSIEEQALAKAFLTICHSSAGSEEHKQKIRALMREKYPDSIYRLTLLEADCLEAWRRHDFTNALHMLDDIQTGNPDTRLALTLLNNLTELPPQTIMTNLLLRVVRTRHVRHLSLRGLKLNSLAPLKGLELLHLICSENAIRGLDPLRGMPLQRLDISHNEIADLSPLRGMPLRSLRVNGNRIDDLTPLRGMSLSELDVARNRIADLSPLTGMRLTRLNVKNNGIADLSPLAHMPLVALNIDGNRIADLSPLTGAPLEKLSCAHNAVKDLFPLKGAPLLSLNCERNRIDDLMPLLGMSLTSLNASANAIADLNPLRGMPLEILRLAGNRLVDLTPVRGCPLNVLDCSDNPGLDIASLLDQPPAMLLDIDTSNLSSRDFNRLLRKWQHYSYTYGVRALRTLRHYRGRNIAALRKLALPLDGKLYLFIPEPMTWEQAVRTAEELGGHLPALLSRKQHDHVISLLPPMRMEIWIGLTTDAEGRDIWLTGDQVCYTDYAAFSDKDTPHPRRMSRQITAGKWYANYDSNLELGFVMVWDD